MYNLIFVIILLLFPFVSFAQDNFFELGAAYLYRENNLAVDDKNERINDYSKPDDGFGKIVPIVNFNYNIDNLYIKSSPLSSVGGGIQAGVNIPDFLYSDTSIYISYSLPKKVWKDPYELNTERSRTYRDSYGMGLKLSEIAGSKFSYEAKLEIDDVRSDVAGRRYDELERDGYVVSQRLYRKIGLNENVLLNFGVAYDKGIYKGDANSYNKFRLLGGLIFNKKEYSARMMYSLGYSKYDEDHPIFGDTREDVSSSVIFSVRKNKIMGNENVFARIYCGLGGNFSNIDFYESRYGLLGMSVGYSF